MKYFDWIGVEVYAANDIVIDEGHRIPAGTVMKVVGARHCRLSVVDIAMTDDDPIEVSMGAIKILPRN